jgi:hypothetical protein
MAAMAELRVAEFDAADIDALVRMWRASFETQLPTCSIP